MSLFFFVNEKHSKLLTTRKQGRLMVHFGPTISASHFDLPKEAHNLTHMERNMPPKLPGKERDGLKL